MGWVEEKARGLWAGVYGPAFAEVSPGVLQGSCPGQSSHTNASSISDCRIYLDYDAVGRPPGAYCLHSSCGSVLDDLNRKFREAIFDKASRRRRSAEGDGVAPAPRGDESIPPFSEEALRQRVRSVPPVDEGWFRARSPIDPRRIASPEDYLEAVFAPGERVLVCLDLRSKGDFGYVVGEGGKRLGPRGVDPVPSRLPIDGGPKGVWYLSNPVDGRWRMNPRRQGEFSLRCVENVTAWRHMVLESDEAEAGLWMRFLAAVELPIAAIYSSGKRSWHALVRADMPDYASFDGMLRRTAKRVLPVFGADPGALTPLRLSRLPACRRAGVEQRLIYINPSPERAILDLPPCRLL